MAWPYLLKPSKRPKIRHKDRLEKRISYSELTLKLDKVFRVFVKLRDCGRGGYGVCITCGEPVHFNEAECGHFIERRNRAVRWDADNGNCQCHKCNCLTDKDTMIDKYREALIKKLGDVGFSELIARSEQPRPTLEKMKEMYDVFKKAVKRLEN